MKPNLTERQTNRIANRIYSNIQLNWWDHVNSVLKTDDDTELNDQDFTNIAKTLAELLHDAD